MTVERCDRTGGLRGATRRRGAIALLATAALMLAGCGSGVAGGGANGSAAAGGAGGSRSAARHAAGVAAGLPAPLGTRTPVSLVLDFTPNAVHAGIFRAIADRLYDRERIDLHVIVPSETEDPLTMVAAGKVDFGLADGSDLANLIAKRGRVKAVMAIGQRPFGGLIARASEHLSSPAALEGRTVGVTGVPSDRAVLDTEVKAAGGNPAKVHVLTVGFDGAASLRAGKIAAFTGFWPDDGVQLAVTGEPVRSFKLDEWGGPAYPGLVAFASDSTIARNPALVRDFVAATVRGYELTLREPEESLRALERLEPEVEPKVASASLADYLPLFDEDGKVPLGELQRRRIEALSRWMLAHHLIGRGVRFSAYGTNRFVPGAGR